MAQPRHIHDLADELLSEILSFLLLEPGFRAFNSRRYGNGRGHNGIVDGDYPHRTPIGYGESSDLGRFRLVCTRFMRIGTPRQFSHFNLRFSANGFRRLDELLQMQLARYVKSVTYLVRPFYQGREWETIIRSESFNDKENFTLLQTHLNRLQEQINLVGSGYDLAQLRKAIASFPALQEIKLLRLQDEADEELLDLISEHYLETLHPPPSTFITFNWESACSRAVTNLGIALLDSQCTAIRFIGPQISPEATRQLLQAPSNTLAAIGGRITSLDINFHSTTDITPTMSDLSGVFHRFFQEAKNLVAIHLGFPQKHPLNLTPDAIFHGIRWKTLRTLSLQGWRLSANEIISLAHRHHHELRELRLVGVYLRAGSRWSTVLSMLRSEMDRLDCLELRGINYDAYLEDLATSAGVEVFDPAPLLPSPPSSLSVVAAGTSPPDNPPLLRGDRMLDRSAMSEKVKGLSADELGDDGVRVRRGQERLWEAWALSPPQSARNGIAYGYGNGNANGNGNGIKIGLR